MLQLSPRSISEAAILDSEVGVDQKVREPIFQALTFEHNQN